MSRLKARVQYVALAILLVSQEVLASESPVPDSARAALTRVMQARNAAQALAGPEASPQALRNAAAELERLSRLLDEQPYRDFSAADNHLHAEQLNIAIPLATIYARLGEREKALRAFASSASIALVPVLDKVGADPDFDSLRGDPAFQAVLERYRKGAIASRKSFATPYTRTLTIEQRIAGLSHFWSEVRHNFSNVDLMPQLDWDAVYLDYLAKVMKAETTAGYYAVLMRLAPLLHDGHTNIYAPDELTSRFYARPPIQTELVEDMVIIRAVHDPRLGGQLRPGDRILEIDGVDVKQYARQQVQPFVSSSTEQDRNVRMYSYQLLAGDQRRPLRLTILDGNGHRSKVTLVRSGSSGAASATFPFHVSSEGIAYLKLDHFESEEGVQAFLKALPQILAAKGLILDVRTNGGGSTHFGLQILNYLTNNPIPLTRAKVQFENQAFRAAAGDSVSWQPLASEQLVSDIPATQRFDGPVALLIGPKTFSAAEDFAAIFAQARRGMLVGETTAGSTGQALMLDLPGGGKARICVKRDTYADGTDFVGQGIRPTVEVKNTVAAVRNGTDPVLLEAQRLLGAVRVGL
jgi:carboxyl-terminal processing protease